MELFKEPHIRRNILTGEEVLVSPHRTKRPWQGKEEGKDAAPIISYDKTCYLCPSNVRANGTKTPDYKDTYVFVNDFSALKKDTQITNYKSGLLEAKGEKGICKVVCFSPNHSLTLSKMTIPEIEKVVKTWQSEFKDLSVLPYINNVQIFENRGDVMGCSNPHPHGQIWAQTSIPKEIKLKTLHFSEYVKNNKETLLETYINQELAEDKRVIYSNAHFAVVVPFWAVWPFETMIIPRKGTQNIQYLNKALITAFANAIKAITSIYDKVFDVPFPYSAGIHQAPSDGKLNNGWHWHMNFYPPLLRSATIKKFMVGYEMFAYPQRDITAEKAAELLKSLKN